MDLSCRFTGDVAVLDLAGPFVVSEDETEILALRSALAALVAEGCTFVALNLARLTFIDARGLGELVSALATLRRGGGELMLIAPTARVQRILSVTRLDRVLHVCESELNAILRLRAQRVPGCGPVGGVDCKTGGRLRTIVSANDSRLPMAWN